MNGASLILLSLNIGIATIYSPVVFGFDVSDCGQNMTVIAESGRHCTINFSTIDYLHRYFEIGYFDDQRSKFPCHCFLDDCYCFDPHYSSLLNKTSNTLSLTMVTVTASDSAVYYAYDMFSFKLDCVYLHVVEKAIHSDTLNGYIEEGDGILFNVTSPNVTYETSNSWRIGNQRILSWPFVVTESSFEIKKVTRRLNNMNVSYLVFEHNDTVSSSFTLNIAYGPDAPLSMLPDKTFYHVNIGDDLGTVICQAECNPDCDLSWETFTKPVSAFGSQLVLENIKPSFEGDYTCTAKRNGKSVTSARTLFIAVKEIRLEIKPRRYLYNARVGEIIPSIQCEASCLPICMLKWIKLPEQTVTNEHILSIGPLSVGNAGEYFCVAEINGSTVKAERSLFILTKDEENNTMMILVITSFSCSVIGLVIIVVLTIKLGACHCSASLGKFRQREEADTNISRTSETRPDASMIYSDLQRENQEDKYEDLNKGSSEEDYVNVTNHI